MVTVTGARGRFLASVGNRLRAGASAVEARPPRVPRPHTSKVDGRASRSSRAAARRGGAEPARRQGSPPAAPGGGSAKPGHAQALEHGRRLLTGDDDILVSSAATPTPGLRAGS